MSELLKPCPIPNCGGKARVVQDGFGVDCEKCGYGTVRIKYWNLTARPSTSVASVEYDIHPEPLGAVIEEMREALCSVLPKGWRNSF